MILWQKNAFFGKISKEAFFYPAERDEGGADFRSAIPFLGYLVSLLRRN
jgi:hypothetical protein